MRILVTGARGMLGSSILRAALKNGNTDIISWDRSVVDLQDQLSLSKALAKAKPDVIVHTAAKVGGIQANVNRPVEFLVDNLRIDSNLLMESVKAGVSDFVYIGSSCMYPKNHRQPLVESDVLAGFLEPTNEGYALSKIVGSRLTEYISGQFNLNYRTLILSNLYGPGDNFDPISSHLVAACIAKVHKAKVQNVDEIEVWGDGEARREFTFVEDVSSWLINSLTQIKKWPALMNLGAGTDYSVNEFYEIAMKVIGHSARLVHDKAKPAGMNQKLMDSSMASKNFSWLPETPIEVGIKFAYTDFLERGVYVA